VGVHAFSLLPPITQQENNINNNKNMLLRDYYYFGTGFANRQHEFCPTAGGTPTALLF
jgi:hypothetical protein